VRRHSVAWLGTAFLAIAGCSSTASPAATTVGATTIPPGTYTADIPEGVEAASGTWTMQVTEDAITWTHPEGQIFSPGDVVEVTSDRIVFASDPACPDQDEPTEGTYQWEVVGSELSFTVESDSCAGRRDTLTSATWELAP
jgi:hypothetical protein